MIRFFVSAYPTLKLFKAGREFDYNGPRHEEGKASFCILIKHEKTK